MESHGGAPPVGCQEGFRRHRHGTVRRAPCRPSCLPLDFYGLGSYVLTFSPWGTRTQKWQWRAARNGCIQCSMNLNHALPRHALAMLHVTLTLRNHCMRVQPRAHPHSKLLLLLLLTRLPAATLHAGHRTDPSSVEDHTQVLIVTSK